MLVHGTPSVLVFSKNSCTFDSLIVLSYKNNSSVVENKVEKSEKFLGLDICSPFDFYGFRS